MIIHQIVETVRETQKKPEKLVLLVGKPGSGKSKLLRELATVRGWEYVNCRTFLTDELLEMVPKMRAQEAPHLIDKKMKQLRAEVIVLDDMQVLFAPVLQVDPLGLLRHLAKNYAVVAAWPGEYKDEKLIAAPVGQQASREYNATGLTIIQIE